MSFIAGYPGECTVCVDPITVGDLIGPYSGGYAHARCIENDQELPERQGVTCTNCFLIKPCPCDDEANAILDRLGIGRAS